MLVAHANGIAIHYRIDGADGAPVIVFANSLGTDLRVWDDVVAILAGEFRMVRYDKRGHGLSQSTPEPYRIEDHAHDLAALLARLKLGPAIVCGVSVGGMIAQVLAVEHKELVRALILSNTGHKIGAEEMWESRMTAIRARGINAIADGVMERWFSPDFRNERADEVRAWRNMMTRTPVEGYLGTCAAIRDAELADLAETIAVPTLCIAGSEDGATPPDLVKSLSKLIPDARFRLIEGVGHLPCVERPDAFAGEMKRFFQEAELVR